MPAKLIKLPMLMVLLRRLSSAAPFSEELNSCPDLEKIISKSMLHQAPNDRSFRKSVFPKIGQHQILADVPMFTVTATNTIQFIRNLAKELWTKARPNGEEPVHGHGRQLRTP